MPLIELQTNAAIAADEQQALMKALSQKTAEILGKPESYGMVSLRQGLPMLFGGSDAPCAFFAVYSLGEVSGEQAERFSADISALLEERCGVDTARIYSKYVGWQDRHLWGYRGGTFG